MWVFAYCLETKQQWINEMIPAIGGYKNSSNTILSSLYVLYVFYIAETPVVAAWKKNLATHGFAI